MKYYAIKCSGMKLLPLSGHMDLEVASAIAETREPLAKWFNEDEIPGKARPNGSYELEFLAGTLLCFASYYGDTLAGIVCLQLKNRQFPSYSVSYWVKSSMQGKGCASIMLKSVVALGFSELNAFRISTGHSFSNDASRRVIIKSGFTHNSTTPDGYILPRKIDEPQKYEDGFGYSILRSRYQYDKSIKIISISVDEILQRLTSNL